MLSLKDISRGRTRFCSGHVKKVLAACWAQNRMSSGLTGHTRCVPDGGYFHDKVPKSNPRAELRTAIGKSVAAAPQGLLVIRRHVRKDFAGSASKP
jgi:hypothetical protein